MHRSNNSQIRDPEKNPGSEPVDSSRRKLFLVAVTVIIIVLALGEGVVRIVSPAGTDLPVGFLSDLLDFFENSVYRDVDWTPVFNWESATNFLSLYEPSPVLGYTMKPGMEIVRHISFTPFKDSEGLQFRIKLSTHGFRSHHEQIAKPPGTFRIACMGDSSTFGENLTYEETYPWLLERKLSEKYPGTDIQVLNFGVPGYSSEQGRKLLDTVVMKYNPDVVTVAYGYNDWVHNPYADREVMAHRQSGVYQVRDFLLRSELLRYIRYLLFRANFAYLESKVEKRPQKLDFEKLRELSENTNDAYTFVPKVSPEQFRENMLYFKRKTQSQDAACIYLIPHVEFRSVMGVWPVAAVKPFEILDAMGKNGEIDLIAPGTVEEEMNRINTLPVLKEQADRIRKKLSSRYKHDDVWLFRIDPFHPNGIANSILADRLVQRIENLPGFKNYVRTSPDTLPR